MKHTQKNENPIRPFAVSINNTTPNQQSVDVFHPFCIPPGKSYGNADGVIIHNLFGDKTYEELLGELRGKITKVSTTLLQLVSGNNRGIIMPFNVHTEQGVNYHGMRILPRIDPFQNQVNTVVVHNEYELNNVDGYSYLKMTIPANTCINVIVYQKEQADQVDVPLRLQRLAVEKQTDKKIKATSAAKSTRATKKVATKK